MFYLLLQDATARTEPNSGAKRETMKVLMTDKNAQYLLKIDATEYVSTRTYPKLPTDDKIVYAETQIL
jgi:hypothetical protein